LTSRHAALNLESTDLAQLVREVVDEHNAGQGEPGQVPILVAIAPGLPLLPLDRIRARLLLRNLLDNARRYSTGTSMGDSTPLVEVNLSRQGDALHLTVRDHGPGVDDAQLPHLTEPFFRTDTARQRTTGGMGLGLYLCRLVAQAHGGSLLVRNAAPGLEVTVTLPLLYY